MNPCAYEVDIRPLAAEDDGGFVAIVPDLPSCRSDGETPYEALTDAYDAVLSWIEAAEALGREIPAPRRVPA
jgi:antitoxin HicB